MKKDLFEHVRHFIEQNRLLEQVSSVIVACSGGADSIALLHLLLRYSECCPIQLIVAHVNYGLRGAESDRDEQLVRTYSQRYNLPFFLKSIPGKKEKDRDLSLQMYCRKVRYDFFAELQQITGAERVALGHTLNDNIENFFLRSLAGTGLEGLKGMLPLADNRLVRPLLSTTRARIDLFLDENGIAYAEDSSNRETNYLRNKIRHFLIPIIETKLQPSFENTFLNTSTILRAENDYLEQIVQQFYRDEDLVQHRPGQISLERYGLGKLHPAIIRRIFVKAMYELIQPERGPEKIFEKTERFLRALEQKRTVPRTSFTSHLTVEATSECIILSLDQPQTKQQLGEQYLEVPGHISLSPLHKTLEATLLPHVPTKKEREQIFHDPDRALFDAHFLSSTLLVRSRRSGDTFRPFNGPGKTSLKKFLINIKIPKRCRDTVPVVLSDNTIIWLAGLRRADLANLSTTTGSCVLLTLRRTGAQTHP